MFNKSRLILRCVNESEGEQKFKQPSLALRHPGLHQRSKQSCSRKEVLRTRHRHVKVLGESIGLPKSSPRSSLGLPASQPRSLTSPRIILATRPGWRIGRLAISTHMLCTVASQVSQQRRCVHKVLRTFTKDSCALA